MKTSLNFDQVTYQYTDALANQLLSQGVIVTPKTINMARIFRDDDWVESEPERIRTFTKEFRL